jgi:hypothetical protein
MPDRASRWRVKVRSDWGRGVSRWAEARRAGARRRLSNRASKDRLRVSQNAAGTAVRRCGAFPHCSMLDAMRRQTPQQILYFPLLPAFERP